MGSGTRLEGVERGKCEKSRGGRGGALLVRAWRIRRDYSTISNGIPIAESSGVRFEDGLPMKVIRTWM